MSCENLKRERDDEDSRRWYRPDKTFKHSQDAERFVSEMSNPEPEANCRLSIWSEKQHEFFTSKYPWMTITPYDTVGCKVCARLTSLHEETGKHVHLSAQWKTGKIRAHGSTKRIRLSSIRKKLHEHDQSTSHGKAQLVVKNYVPNNLPSIIFLFNTLYGSIKLHKSVADLDKAIRLQKKNGSESEAFSFNDDTVDNIIGYVSERTRKAVFSEIIENKSKISLVMNHASDLFDEDVLILFIKCVSDRLDEPEELFLDIKEAKSTDAETAADVSLSTLAAYGFTEHYLKEHLVCVLIGEPSDSTNYKSELSNCLLRKFPGLITRHIVHDRFLVGEFGGVDSFLEKLYYSFRTSSKFRLSLFKIVPGLYYELIEFTHGISYNSNIDKMYDVMMCICRNYPSLYDCFSKVKLSKMREIMENLQLLKDLSFVTDLISEICILYGQLTLNLTCEKTDRLTRECLKRLDALKNDDGNCQKFVKNLMEDSADYKRVPFVTNPNYTSLSRIRVIDNIARTIKHKTLDDDSYEKVMATFDLLEPKTWPEDVTYPWFSGEAKLGDLNNFIKCAVSIEDFRNLTVDHTPESVQQARKIIKLAAIRSVVTEEAFFIIDEIIANAIRPLTTATISHMLTIIYLGKPLSDWDATPFATPWLLQKI